MDIEEYQSKDIAGKILYLASLFKGIKDHLDVLNEREELNQVESQIFTILNDLDVNLHFGWRHYILIRDICNCKYVQVTF